MKKKFKLNTESKMNYEKKNLFLKLIYLVYIIDFILTLRYPLVYIFFSVSGNQIFSNQMIFNYLMINNTF
jgi:hypothetical protein